ncbi:MAG: hypothetical protein QOJ73_5769 [Streptosporangiaceae bacterium]|jgi:hypothetical protein|nr:hypothetical protein [Streptosporangiaceae bacterium]
MAIPTDRGYAVIIPNKDHTTTVMVCIGIENAKPVGVFAKHVRAARVRVDPALRLEQAGSYQYTAQIVEVAPGDGAVQVRAPRQ